MAMLRSGGRGQGEHPSASQPKSGSAWAQTPKQHFFPLPHSSPPVVHCGGAASFTGAVPPVAVCSPPDAGFTSPSPAVPPLPIAPLPGAPLLGVPPVSELAPPVELSAFAGTYSLSIPRMAAQPVSATPLSESKTAPPIPEDAVRHACK
jgi:hypothetical protein